jgi:Acyclic terpene utilisation family protein AtuA
VAGHKSIVRIGCGASSWGDDVGEPRELLQRAPLDYLIMDYLAEVTLSIMRLQMDRDPARGYATDVVTVISDILPLLAQHGTKVVTNAGGLNPLGCATAIAKVVAEAGLAGKIRIAVVDGDDLMPRLTELSATVPFTNLDDGRPFADIRDRVTSANAYLGARPIRAALDLGADIVITGRCVDVAMTLGPLLYEFDWRDDDWNRIGAGVVAGHLLECGPQSTGGNHQGWKTVPGLEHVGYPIVEVSANGDVVLTKAPGTGGIVNAMTATDQLLHEIFDPKAFLSPDATVDWTSFTLHELGNDRVLINGVQGGPPPASLKVSMTYRDGFRTVLMWPYTWPDARLKAEAALRKMEHTVQRLGLRLDATRGDIFGMGAIHGRRLAAAGLSNPEPLEVFARFAARSVHRRDIQRLAAQQAPMHKGAPGLAGQLAGGRGDVTQIYTHWPALIPADLVASQITMLS